MHIGYARVSSEEQDTTAQVSALERAGCERIFREKAPGSRWDRPELQLLLEQLRAGDVLVVWKLDRLSRSLRDVLLLMDRLARIGAGFRSLTEAIDTTTAAGRMMMQMVGVFGVPSENGILRTLSRGNEPNGSETALCWDRARAPEIISGQVDVLPAQRRQVFQ